MTKFHIMQYSKIISGKIVMIQSTSTFTLLLDFIQFMFWPQFSAITHIWVCFVDRFLHSQHDAVQQTLHCFRHVLAVGSTCLEIWKPGKEMSTLWYMMASWHGNAFLIISPLWVESASHNSLVQDCSNSSALAMELLQSCTKPLIYCAYWQRVSNVELWCFLYC